MKSNIGRKIWKTTGGNTIVFGTVKEERVENSWLLVKVDWSLPPGRPTDLTEWQKFSNLGSLDSLEQDLVHFRKEF